MDESKSSAEGRTDHPEVCAGDPFFAAGRRTHGECVEAMRQEEARLGRKMTDREREGFARGFHAPEYRAEIRRLMAFGVEGAEEVGS